MTPFLEVRDIRKTYGAIKAVDGVSLSVRPGEIVGVIGPNGSGKTTLFNSILGQIQPTTGHVEFCGEDITGMAPLALSRRGIGRTFQTLQVFVKLSVRDNLIAAAKELKNWDSGGMIGTPVNMVNQRLPYGVIYRFNVTKDSFSFKPAADWVKVD